MAEEKTEAPTPKRRKEARKEGQVPRTPELGSWLIMLAFAGAIGPITDRLREHFTDRIKQAAAITADPEQADAVRFLGDSLQFAAVTIVLIGVGAMFIGVVASMAQGGFYIASKAAKPSFSKVNPGKGLKKLFSPTTLWEGLKTLAKSVVLGLILYHSARGLLPLLGGPVLATSVLTNLGSTLTRMMFLTAGAGLLMAAADYAFQRRRVNKQIRMSKQEIKQEHKNTEGDPLIKSAIRSRALAAARNRMMNDVGSADAILVNPTHIAIAIKYDPNNGAPRVVAKGAGNIAAKIREKGAESAVPIVRDIPLARALYASCKIGQEIPLELFAAVAQVLAFVINRRNRGLTETGEQHSSPRPDLDLPAVESRRINRAVLAGADPDLSDEVDGDAAPDEGALTG